MQVVELASPIDFAGWRAAARALRAEGTPPQDVDWSVADHHRLPMPPPPPPPATTAAGAGAFTVPQRFLKLAADVVCHRGPRRFDLLYRLLWRFEREPDLLGLQTDPDVAEALIMAKAVSRASHKMKAFVRFRRVGEPGGAFGSAADTYVAWFEPPHRVLARTAPFFRDRFATMRFSILTPDACCHWDGDELTFTPGVSRPHIGEDELEAVWLTYYRSIFNPARLKTAAMQSEMPKRYWRNLPEAALIPELVAEAETRARSMVDSDPTQPRRRLPAAAAMRAPEAAGGGLVDPAAVRTALQACRRCDLWRDATQAVPGEGPAGAPLMLVGEQPGDMEDIEGRPFVGPAGQLLDRALAAAGVSRADAYVTNAVKHFKNEPRGKRRLHKTPDAGEVQACRWWLEQERALVRPRLIVALGGTAALAVFGEAMPIMKSRGRLIPLEGGARALITVQPSYLLRLPDETARAGAWRDFVADLATAQAALATA